MPTDQDLAAYANIWPPVFRDILAAFPAVEPGRSAEYGLAFPTIAAHFVNTGKPWSFGDVQVACLDLARGGFVAIKQGIFVHPTPLGERLIAILTRTAPAQGRSLPPLPPPPPSW